MSEGELNDKAAIDIDQLRARYAAERAKRQTKVGTDQYVFADGQYARFADDPYAGEAIPRDAIDRELDVLIIGAGIGGIQLGATLLKQGIKDFCLVDIAADFGGTWYWNRYPGLRCDVESYIYLPLLELTGYVPTERYVRGSEIHAYLKRLASQLDLDGKAHFQTRVTAMRWDEDAARWRVSTNRGDTFGARFVTTQSGIFGRPQLPGIKGINEFTGHSFHSARWDYDYTGGSPDEPMTKLGDKRIGLIGTGTTALQVVPELATAAKSVTIFQRTPTAVGVRGNNETDLDWFLSQPDGWQQERIKSFNQLSMGELVDCPVKDGWTDFFSRLVTAVTSLPPDKMTPEAIDLAQERADLEYNESIRSRIGATVRDPRKADLLKAYYRTMCKRPGFSDHYLPAMDQENVELVDVSGGIERITATGMIVEGVEYPLDCLIFCTGFELGTTWVHQAGYDVAGRKGRLLSEKWEHGLSTYHGLFSHDFPNAFFMGLTQTGITINVPHMLQEQADHIAFIIRHCLEHGVRTVETTPDAEASWQDTMGMIAEARRPFQEACTPGYYNAEGQVDDRRSAIGSGWYLPSTQFFGMWERWREAGNFEGLVLSR